MSMSSYSIAQLAAMERERIRENIKKSIDIISGSDNAPTIKHGISYESDSSDLGDSGAVDYSSDLNNSILVNSSGQISRRVDLSVLLNDAYKDDFVIQIDELKNLIKEIQSKVKDTEKVNNLISWVNKILVNDSVDIEDKIKQIKRRLDGFLSINSADITSNYYEETTYKELCRRLGVEAKELPNTSMRMEIDRLFEQLCYQEERKYIRESIDEIMLELGLTIDSECVLDETDGFLYDMSDIKTCKLFVSADGSGLMLDAVAIKDESTSSSNEIENDAGNVCKLKAQIVKKAAERGIILKTEVEIEPNYSEMSKESNVKKKKESDDDKRRRKTTKEKGLTV